MIKFTVPGELCDLNTYIDVERTNRYAAAKIKEEMTETCCWYAKLSKLKTDKRVFITFRWYCRNTRKDMDNISFAKKYVLDGMVQVGVLKNDGWKQIAGFTDEFYVDKENPRVEIELRELEGGAC